MSPLRPTRPFCQARFLFVGEYRLGRRVAADRQHEGARIQLATPGGAEPEVLAVRIHAFDEGVLVKEYACGDVVPGCGAHFRAADEAEMLALCTVHAQHAHGRTEPAMPDDLVGRIRAAMREVPSR